MVPLHHLANDLGLRIEREQTKPSLSNISHDNVTFKINMASPSEPPMQTPSFLEEENVHVELTPDPLHVTKVMSRVKSPKAGAVVLFAGMCGNSSSYKGFYLSSPEGRPVTPSTAVQSKSFNIPPMCRSLSELCSQSPSP